MKLPNLKKPLTITILFVSIIVLLVGTIAFFTDRVDDDVKFQISTFSKDGYEISRKAPTIPYIAGETVTVPVTETNKKNESIETQVHMSASWICPDPSSKLWGNPNAEDNLVIKCGDDVVSYTVEDDGSITFILPDHLLEAGATQTRNLQFIIPESLYSTGNIDVDFTQIDIQQHPTGFTQTFERAELNAEEKLDFPIRIGWAAGATTPKSIMGFLDNTEAEGEYAINFEFPLDEYDTDDMMDFPSQPETPWEHYAPSVTELNFVEGMTGIGDYAFAEFEKITAITLPESTESIRLYAFDNTKIESLTIPAKVSSIETMAFGHIEELTEITFNTPVDAELNLPVAGSTTGAFYVDPYVHTKILGLNETAQGYDWITDQRRLAPIIRAYEYEWNDRMPVNGGVVACQEDFHADEYRLSVTSAVFEDANTYYAADNYAAISAMKSGSLDTYTNGNIIYWNVTDPDYVAENPYAAYSVIAALDSTTGKLTIMCDGFKTFANQTSDFLFGLMDNLDVIDARKYDTSLAEYMWYWHGFNDPAAAPGEPIMDEVGASKILGTEDWDVSNVSDFADMFRNATRLSELEVGTWNTGSAVYMDGMFMGCRSLTSLDVKTKVINAGTANEYTAWDMSNVVDIEAMFTRATGLTDGSGIESWSMPSLQTMEMAFATTNFKSLNLNNWKPDNLENMYQTFMDSNVENLNISEWTTPNLVTLQGTFMGTKKLTTLDLSKLNTSKVETMLQAFQNSGIQELNATGWDFTSCGITEGMFTNAASLENIIGEETWTNMGGIFRLEYMFDGCESLETLSAADWDVSGAYPSFGYTAMFRDCKALTSIDVSNWTVTGVKTFGSMFMNCESLPGIDISQWDIHKSASLTDMFNGCRSFTELTFPVGVNFITIRMAANCPNLTNITFLTESEFAYRCTPGEEDGAFYVSPDAGVTIPVITSVSVNDGMKNVLTIYDWSLDNRAFPDYTSPVLYITDPAGTTAQEPKKVAANIYTIKGTVSDADSDVRYVTVNGVKATVKADGTWTANVTLAHGDNAFTVVATDSYYNTTTEYCYIHNTLRNVELHYKDGVTPSETIEADSRSDLPIPEREGYTFVGWYLANNVGVIDISNFTNPNSTYPWTLDTSTGIWSSGNAFVNNTKSTSDMISEEFTLPTDGSVSFEWRSNGEAGYDYLGYDIWDVTNQRYVSGRDGTYSSCYANLKNAASTEFTPVTHELPAGTYQIVFMYGKDSSVNNNEDKGFVKNIKASYLTEPEASDTPVPDVITEDIIAVAKWQRIAPVLAAGDAWFRPADSSVTKTSITEIEIKDSYTPSGAVTASWDASEARNGSVMAYIEGTKLTIAGNGFGKVYANVDSSYAFGNNQSEYGSFSNVTTFTGAELLDTSNTQTMNGMFGGCSSLKSLNTSNWDVSKVESAWSMFYGCKSLETLDVSKWDVSNVRHMYAMFYNCSSLEYLDVSKWDTGSVYQMEAMFQKSAIKTLDVSKWDTSSVQYMNKMFSGCTSLETLDVSKWDVSKVTTFDHMFAGGAYGEDPLTITNLDVSTWDTSSATDMSFMFYSCQGPGSIDVSGWDVSKITTFDHMFAHSWLSIGDISNWKPEAVTNLNAIFHTVQNTKLDVSGFNTSKVTVFEQMFENCTQLTELIGLENFDTSAGLGFAEMFQDCSSLKELNLSSFDTRNAKDGEFASENGGTTRTLLDMFVGMNKLEKIILGPNFSFNGDGTTTTNAGVLPTPSSEYITGANGKWYRISDRKTFTPNEVPSYVAATYVANSTQYTIPERAVYYVGVTSTTIGNYTGATTTYTAGDDFPTPSAGDVFVYGDYEYRYDMYWDNGWHNNPGGGWSPRVLDANKVSYEPMLESINGSNICVITCAYANCTQMVETPRLPNNITWAGFAFANCSSLKQITNLPDSSYSLQGTFMNCTSLVSVPSIPAGVRVLQNTFTGCTSLEGVIEINANPAYYDYCFAGTTKSILLTGTSSILEELAATDGYTDFSTNDNVRVDREYFYSSVAQAVSDVNNGAIGANATADPSNAVAIAYVEDGVNYVKMINDSTESERIKSSADMVIDINGHTLSSLNSIAIQVDSGDLTINGNASGSTIENKHTDSDSYCVVVYNDSNVTILGGTYVSSTEGMNCLCVASYGTSNVDISNATFNASGIDSNVTALQIAGASGTISNSTILATTTNGKAHGVYNYGNIVISESDIRGYSNYNSSYTFAGYGIRNAKNGILTINNSSVSGIHSGLATNGTLYVNGGTYESSGHGGIYFGNASKTAYVKDATLRECSMPEGFINIDNNSNGAGFYIGGNSSSNNITVYMDNCDIYGSMQPVVLRGTDGEQYNNLYISNSRINLDYTTTGVRIDNDTHKLYIGAGNNFGIAQTNLSSAVVLTEEVYTYENVAAASVTFALRPNKNTQQTEDVFSDPLTGETLSEASTKRPFIVSLNNIQEALPQHGINEASFVYEMLVEGGITRCLGVYSDVSDVAKIGSIRSARTYFVDIAKAYDGILVYAGCSDNVKPLFESYKLDGLDALLCAEGKYFYRDQERLAAGVSNEHTLFSSGQGILEYAQERELELERDSMNFGLKFAENVALNGEAANEVTLTFTGGKTTTMKYNAETGLYEGSQFDEEYIDGNTCTPVPFRNVLVLNVNTSLAGELLTMELIGSGTGYFACDGKIVPINWSRNSMEEPFQYTLEDGTPLTFGVGTTYAAILSVDTDASVTFE